ncbi:MAG: hypothetical protein SPK73_00725, partial [Eubacteriales bacterium]|nr:hypothetical protein [Eubacteriales bacterium]
AALAPYACQNAMYSCQAAATWCIINKPIRKKGLFVTFKAAFFDRDNTPAGTADYSDLFIMSIGTICAYA